MTTLEVWLLVAWMLVGLAVAAKAIFPTRAPAGGEVLFILLIGAAIWPTLVIYALLPNLWSDRDKKEKSKD